MKRTRTKVFGRADEVDWLTRGRPHSFETARKPGGDPLTHLCSSASCSISPIFCANCWRVFLKFVY